MGVQTANSARSAKLRQYNKVGQSLSPVMFSVVYRCPKGASDVRQTSMSTIFRLSKCKPKLNPSFSKGFDNLKFVGHVYWPRFLVAGSAETVFAK